MQSIHTSRLLKGALMADAGVSAATAALQLLAAPQLTTLLALPQALLTQTGLFMIGYVLMLSLMATRATLWSWIVGLVAFGNFAWALGCIALAGTGLLTPSAWGVAFLAVQAVGVTGLAWLELLGWRRSVPANSAHVVTA